MPKLERFFLVALVVGSLAAMAFVAVVAMSNRMGACYY
jgi:hypothetical protein